MKGNWKIWASSLAVLVAFGSVGWAQEPLKPPDNAVTESAGEPPKAAAQAAPVVTSPAATPTSNPVAAAEAEPLAAIPAAAPPVVSPKPISLAQGIEPTAPKTADQAAAAGQLVPPAALAVTPEETKVATSTLGPRIMTPSMMRKQQITSPDLVVHFVVVDDDPVVSVKINGDLQKVEPNKTLLITRKLHFNPGRTLIEVQAEDQAGNVSNRSFLVLFEPAAAEAAEDSNPLKWNLIIEAVAQTDDNPTEDLSSPVKIGDLELQGVVEDSQQTDQLKNLKALLVVYKGDYNGIFGASSRAYDKAANELLNSQVLFAGAGWKHLVGDGFFIKADYLFTDLNLGAADYAQYHGITPALLWETKDDTGVSKHTLALELVTKKFAELEQEDGAQQGLKWLYQQTDPDKDRFDSVMSVGTASQGTDDSVEDYLIMSFNWHNQWAGPFFDIGFDVEYEKYKNQVPLSANTPLGKTRLDLPVSYQTALGWQGVGWSLKYHYRYLLNLSNKVLYERTVHGINGSATF